MMFLSKRVILVAFAVFVLTALQGTAWTKEVHIKGASALVIHFYEKSVTYDARLSSQPVWLLEPSFRMGQAL